MLLSNWFTCFCQNYSIFNILDDIYLLQEKVKELNPKNTISFIKIPLIPKIVQFKQDSHFTNFDRGLEILIFNDFLDHLSHREAPSLSDAGIILTGDQVIHEYGAWREKSYMGVHLNDKVRVKKLREIGDWFGGEKPLESKMQTSVVLKSLREKRLFSNNKFFHDNKSSIFAKSYVYSWLAKNG